MPPIWQIRLKDQYGSTVAVLDKWRRLRIMVAVNEPGGYELEFADLGDGLPELFEPDGQIEFWRRHTDAGIPWRKEFEAFHVNLSRWADASGALQYESRGWGYVDLLNRRIVDAYAGSPEGAKSGLAEKVIKEYVNEQAGPGAGARAIYGLSIEADAGGGKNITLARSYRSLLSVCQDIAAIGGGDFSVVGTGPASFEFRWYEGQRGTDRRAEVLFALRFGNMGEPRYVLTRSEEANAILIAGQGEGEERVRFWQEDMAAQATSPWNRREEFVDARDIETIPGLEDRAATRLWERRVMESLSFRVLQTLGMAYGRDYFLGDLVRGEFAGHVIDQKISGLIFTVDARQEQLEVVLQNV